jgi:hypothetical protein
MAQTRLKPGKPKGWKNIINFHCRRMQNAISHRWPARFSPDFKQFGGGIFIATVTV